MEPRAMVDDIDYFMAHGDYQRAQAILTDLQAWVTDSLKQCQQATDK